MKIEKRVFLMLFIICVLAFTATPGLAIMADQINFQGELADASGIPVDDDIYAVTFAIYDTLLGGTPLWSEASVPVTVVNGIFNARLPHDPGTSPFPVDLFDNELYLGVKVWYWMRR